MTEPLVSIITPTYNHERYIPTCIESVLAQSYRRWELLIVDDGSTDNTGTIAALYADADSRIRVGVQPNRGIWDLQGTYNQALARARGDLVAILEGDDFWPADKLSTQVELHQKHPDLLLSYGKVGLVRDDRQVGWYGCPPATGVRLAAEYLKLALVRRSLIMAVSVMVQRSALELIGGFQQPTGFPAVDFPTWLAVLRLPGSAAWIDRTLGYWRQHPLQVTQGAGVELALGALHAALHCFGDLDDEERADLRVTEGDIVRASSRPIADAYLQRLRTALVGRDRGAVQADAAQLWAYGNWKRRVQAAYAVLAAPCGLDMEWLLRSFEKFGT